MKERCYFQCQNIQYSDIKMKKQFSKPDAETHRRVHLQDRDVNVNFRYYSPGKSDCSLEIACEQRFISVPFSDPSERFTDQASIIHKNTHDPKEISDKFYQQQLGDARNSILQYYQKFQQRLLAPHINLKKPSQAKKATRINLCHTRNTERKQEKKSAALNSIGRNLRTDQRRQYVKRAQISLVCKKQSRQGCEDRIKSGQGKQNKGSKNQKDQKATGNAHQTRFKIKLYEEAKQDKKQKEQAYRTPRVSNRKKGIRVFSSASTQKHSQSYFTENEEKRPILSPKNKLCTENKGIINKSEKKRNIVMLSRRGGSVSKFNHLSLNQKRKRLFSKQKIEPCYKPRINLYQTKL